jgi:putative redox protein
MEGKARLCEGLQFVGRSDSGHSIVMDGPVAAGGSDTALRPSELVLIGLAGCTGMDVISILRKKRQPVTGLEVVVSAEQAAEHPRAFRRLKVRYIVQGAGVDEAAVRRAIELSEEKYCSVGATLKESVEMTSSFEITS